MRELLPECSLGPVDGRRYGPLVDGRQAPRADARLRHDGVQVLLLLIGEVRARGVVEEFPGCVGVQAGRGGGTVA